MWGERDTVEDIAELVIISQIRFGPIRHVRFDIQYQMRDEPICMKRRMKFHISIPRNERQKIGRSLEFCLFPKRGA